MTIQNLYGITSHNQNTYNFWATFLRPCFCAMADRCPRVCEDADLIRRIQLPLYPSFAPTLDELLDLPIPYECEVPAEFDAACLIVRSASGKPLPILKWFSSHAEMEMLLGSFSYAFAYELKEASTAYGRNHTDTDPKLHYAIRIPDLPTRLLDLFWRGRVKKSALLAGASLTTSAPIITVDYRKQTQ